MPPRGYAQGMISSYARYLGLNPREVVEAYFDELRVYEQTTSSAGGCFQDAAGYVSPRSASATGRFMMVEPPRSRYGQRPPQAGYVSEAHSGHEPQRVGRPRPAQPGRALPGQTTSLGRPVDQGRAPRGRYDDPARGRRPAPSGGQRGTAYRGGGSRPASGARRSPQGRAGDSRRGGFRRPPQPSSSLSPTVLMGIIAGAALIIIVLLAMLLFRGCAPAAEEPSAGSTITVDKLAGTDGSNSSSNDGEKDGQDSDADADTDAGADADADGKDDDGQNGDASKEPEETVVTISVKDGESSWLEVRLDGTIVFGNEVYGPWTQEYTVEDSLRITANTPGSVTVKQNGETVRWDTSTSGVARINITAPKKKSTDDADGRPATARRTHRPMAQPINPMAPPRRRAL